MPSINIPASLTVSTQIPVDSKTYKKTVSEITTITSEQAYMYYAGMRIDVAENNKQYVWKQTVENETAISNTFTYPANHTVDGYDYGNKSFAFYEIVVSNNTPDPEPEPDDRFIYIPDVVNKDYTSANSSHSTLVYGSNASDPDADGYITKTFEIRPVASSTLRVFHTPFSIHTPAEEIVPLRIELVQSPDAVLVGDNGQYPTIGDAVLDGHTNIQLTPGSNTLDTIGPIDTDLTLHIGSDVSIFTPAGSFLTNNGKKQNIILYNGAQISTTTPIVEFTGTSNASTFNIKGDGSLKANNLSGALITGTSASTGYKVNVENIGLDLTNTQLASLKENATLSLSNNDIKLVDQSKPLVSATNAVVSTFNTNMSVNTTGTVALFDTNGSSDVMANNMVVKGTTDSLVKVSNPQVVKANITLANVNLEGLTGNNVLSAGGGVIADDLQNVKLVNMQVANSSIVDNSVTGFSIANVIQSDGTKLDPSTGDGVSKEYVDDADELLDVRLNILEGYDLDARVTTLENSGVPSLTKLTQFTNYEVAYQALGPDYAFINTNNGNSDKSTWFVDFTRQ